MPSLIAALIFVAVLAGYYLGRTRPLYTARDWARFFIVWCTGEERWFRTRAWLALLLVADEHKFRQAPPTRKVSAEPVRVNPRWSRKLPGDDDA